MSFWYLILDRFGHKVMLCPCLLCWDYWFTVTRKRRNSLCKIVTRFHELHRLAVLMSWQRSCHAIKDALKRKWEEVLPRVYFYFYFHQFFPFDSSVDFLFYSSNSFSSSCVFWLRTFFILHVILDLHPHLESLSSFSSWISFSSSIS